MPGIAAAHQQSGAVASRRLSSNSAALFSSAVSVVLATTRTTSEQRAFGLADSLKFAAGDEAVDSLEKRKTMRGLEAAMSSSTIIDCLAACMKVEEKSVEDVLKNVEAKFILIRLLQRVLQPPTVLLFEPLVSVAAAQGLGRSAA